MKSFEFRCMHCGESFGRNVIGLALHIRERHDAHRQTSPTKLDDGKQVE